MSERLIAIGDIHGHHTELMALYQLILNSGFNPNVDTLIGLGDAVDGGPDTRKVLDQMIAWQQANPHWVFLRGNHEQMMLDALATQNKPGTWRLWWGQGGRATAYSYLPTDASDYDRAIMQPEDHIDPRHIEWIRLLPLRHKTAHYHFVHAGFRPGVTISEQSEEDMLWIREDFFNARYDFGKPVIYGHTPTPEPTIRRALVSPDPVKPIVSIGIDTMVGDYGKLTAVELNPGDPTVQPRFYCAESVIGLFNQFRGF